MTLAFGVVVSVAFSAECRISWYKSFFYGKILTPVHLFSMTGALGGKRAAAPVAHNNKAVVVFWWSQWR